jgi:fluoride exporter
VRWTLFAAAGGAIGALGRAGVAELVPRSTGEFPWATLIVNLIGCLAIGVAARRLSPRSGAWPFAVTGVIGGFTTYSTFANETRDLLAEWPIVAIVYVVVTVAAGYACVEIGLRSPGTVAPVERSRR